MGQLVYHGVYLELFVVVMEQSKIGFNLMTILFKGEYQMDRLDKQDLELLMQHGGNNPCISIYMPTLKGREKAKENITRFKGLVKKTEEQLSSMGLSPEERKKLMEPAKKIISESVYWASQSEGFVFFISNDFHRYYRLPLPLDEMAIVRYSFHFKPLFELFSADDQFYILALSQKQVRLLYGNRSTAEEIDLTEIMDKLETEFGEIDFEPDLQFHTGTPDSTGTRSAVFHGHGGTIEGFQKERLLNYLRFIDREMQGQIEGNNAPLILACVDYLAPLYREISKYPVVFDETVKGNPENVSAIDLHRKAWQIIQPHFKEKQEECKNRYLELKGTGKTSNSILEILPAAYHGRISELFVVPGLQQWGYYNSETEEVILSETSQAGYEDLIDLAAVKSFANNGNIYALDESQMPDSTPVAAILRW